MPFVHAKCPVCGGVLDIDDSKKAVICQFCNEPFIVEEAINNYYTYNTTNNTFNTDNRATHNYSDGTIVNVYEDTNKDFVIEAGVLKEYHGASTNVVIPEGVYQIYPDCFNGMLITNLKLPASLKDLSNINSLQIFNFIELHPDNPYFTKKNNIIYSKDECTVEAFVGSEREYTLNDNVNNFSATAKKQLSNIIHLYFKNKDLLNVNCCDSEIINIAKGKGLSPIIKHELVDCKCVHCQKYILDSCVKGHIHYVSYYCSFSITLSFVDNEKVIFSNQSIYDLHLLNDNNDVQRFSGQIKNSLKEKLANVKTLILLDLNENHRKYNELIGLRKYSDTMKNLLDVLFPNIDNIVIEEDTGYYDSIKEKQVSLLDDLVFPFIAEKLNNSSLQVSWNKNIPVASISKIAEKVNAKADKVKAEAEKQRLIAEWKSKGLCQYCGGRFKGIFTIKCSKCGKLKDYEYVNEVPSSQPRNDSPIVQKTAKNPDTQGSILWAIPPIPDIPNIPDIPDIPEIPEIPEIPDTTSNKPLHDESNSELYVLECPCCGGDIQLRSEDLEKENIVCPNCNNLLELDLEYQE